MIVDLIAATTTDTGLRILAEWDQGDCPTGIKISDDELEALNITKHKWHPDWNYDLKPRHHTNK